MVLIRKDLVKGRPEKHFPIRPRFLIQKDVRHLMGNGIMGNPKPATLEKGKAFFQMAVQGVIGALEELETLPRKK
jgi:creatinine amidohydrolase